eukprot:CAMPEP_0175058694 /NCGR_PEP_ID=MMETSP0052_2-20121109/11996_1 /TAXON_ID=51329 ORGANISM="Polytomella parva, Strain SAG 63-3" /NCGR_SAMPLE_ID=MMETSP0052_2 /ASSEMBLY_ACC=CAM_ASM_000194 /LENGTH=137 /DNA_ID=CAMNT_0016324115 /DNA_START=603 /DNA_END=1016 /DNA_ORIENTATION=-
MTTDNGSNNNGNHVSMANSHTAVYSNYAPISFSLRTPDGVQITSPSPPLLPQSPLPVLLPHSSPPPSPPPLPSSSPPPPALPPQPQRVGAATAAAETAAAFQNLSLSVVLNQPKNRREGGKGKVVAVGNRQTIESER